MRISDWSSDVCSSDLQDIPRKDDGIASIRSTRGNDMIPPIKFSLVAALAAGGLAGCAVGPDYRRPEIAVSEKWVGPVSNAEVDGAWWRKFDDPLLTELVKAAILGNKDLRSEEHTSELQSLMRISYAVFCLNKKKQQYVN